MEPATATVQLSPADIKAFSRFARKNSKLRWMTWLPMLIGVAIVLVLHQPSDPKPPAKQHKSEMSQRESVPQHYLTARALWSVAPILFLLTLLGLYVWWAKRPSTYESSFPGIFQSRTFELTEQGFLARSERGEALTYWKFILRFTETADAFYVMLAARNGHILPKRCFPNLESMAIFRNQMRLHLEQHAPTALTEGKL